MFPDNEIRLNAPLSVHSWAGFFGLLGLFFRSFCCSFFVLFFLSFLDRFWGAFGRHFGAQIASECDLCWSSVCVRERVFWCFLEVLIRFVFCIDI